MGPSFQEDWVFGLGKHHGLLRSLLSHPGLVSRVCPVESVLMSRISFLTSAIFFCRRTRGGRLWLLVVDQKHPEEWLPHPRRGEVGAPVARPAAGWTTVLPTAP